MGTDNRTKTVRTAAEWFKALDQLNSEPFRCEGAQLVTPEAGRL
jgi:hypothetical protein